jgi:hypothetical protein
MALMMEAPNSSKPSASVYQKKKRNVPEHFIVCVLLTISFMPHYLKPAARTDKSLITYAIMSILSIKIYHLKKAKLS